MIHGTICVSTRNTASVLIGSKRWLQMPKAVAIGECVCTAPVSPGRVLYERKCIWNSTDGLLVPWMIEPSGRMWTSMSSSIAPLNRPLGVIQMVSPSPDTALMLPPVGVRCPLWNSSLTICTICWRASLSVTTSSPLALGSLRAAGPCPAACKGTTTRGHSTSSAESGAQQPVAGEGAEVQRVVELEGDRDAATGGAVAAQQFLHLAALRVHRGDAERCLARARFDPAASHDAEHAAVGSCNKKVPLGRPSDVVRLERERELAALPVLAAQPHQLLAEELG